MPLSSRTGRTAPPTRPTKLRACWRRTPAWIHTPSRACSPQPDQRPAPAPRGWPAGLTDREVEVLRLIARGRSNREVAERLVISTKTVGRHVENVYAKIGVSSRAAAAVFAMENRLLG